MCLCGVSTLAGFSKKAPEDAFKEISKWLLRGVSHLLWLRLQPILNRWAISMLLNKPKFLREVGEDKWLYITKIKDAWVVGLLMRF